MNQIRLGITGGFKLFPSSGILKTRKHDVSETVSVSVFRRGGGGDTYSHLGPLHSANLNHWTDPVTEMSCFLVPRVPGDGKNLKKPVILSAIHHHCQNPLEPTRFGLVRTGIVEYCAEQRDNLLSSHNCTFVRSASAEASALRSVTHTHIHTQGSGIHQFQFSFSHFSLPAKAEALRRADRPSKEPYQTSKWFVVPEVISNWNRRKALIR
jgi:hypothetical protein